jgi:hypothetical protein
MGDIISSFAFRHFPLSYDETASHLQFIKREELNGFSGIIEHQVPIRYYHLCNDYLTMIVCHGSVTTRLTMKI